MRRSLPTNGPGPFRGGGARAVLAFAFVALLLAAAPLAAQAGQITGRVVDAATGRPLASARVAVQGLPLAASTRVDGRYQITGVPAGAQALSVTRLGYASKTVTDVSVTAGGTVTQDVTLSAAALLLEAVTVTAAAERGSVTAALDEQRTAVGVVNAVSAEQISRSPDGDAAAAVRRVSGVTVRDGRFVVVRGLSERYTTASLNGARIPSAEPERRVVPLDLFPAGLLEGVSTTKTFTPDLSGDFSGALVNVRTRAYPAQPTYSVSSSVGYTAGVTGETVMLPPLERVDWLAFGSDRGVPGAVAGFGTFRDRSPTAAERNAMVRSFRDVWLPRSQTAQPGGSFSATVGNSTGLFGREVGYVGSFSYSRDVEALKGYQRAQVLLADQETGAVTEIDRFDGSVARVGVLWGGVLNLSASLGADSRIAFTNTYNRSAENEARVETGSIETENLDAVTVHRMRLVERGVRSSQLRGEHRLARGSLAWSVTSSGIRRVEPDRSEWLMDVSGDTPRWYAVSNQAAVRTFGRLDEGSWEAATDYHLPLGGADRHRVSVGGLFRATDRDARNTAYSISALGLPAGADALSPAEIFGRFTGADDAYFQIVPLSQGGSYAAEDRVTAGYAMAELGVTGRVRVIGGARVEHSALTLDSETTDGTTSRTRPTYTDVLPSLSVNVDLTETQKVRFSVSQTLSRPEYREVSSVAFREVIGGDVVQGNPELRRSRIRNLDARWEWYPAADEVVSVGVFAKRFDAPIERIYLPTSGTRLVSFTNAASALNYGVELELRKSLGMLGGFGRSLTALANATLVRSDVEVVGEDENRPMVGQSPYVVNAGFSYADAAGRTSATLLYNVFGRRITSAGLGVLPELYEEPRHVLDLSLRHALGGNVSVKVDAENLLDSPYEFTQGSVVRERWTTGRSVSLGVSWRN